MNIDSREAAQAALQNALRLLDEVTVQHRSNRLAMVAAESEIESVLRYLVRGEKEVVRNGNVHA